MGAMLLNSGLTEAFPPVVVAILNISGGGDFLCLGLCRVRVQYRVQ